ncbi:unnamed protein product [Didymodactylos carnosus]|uniref:Uncharacterized protein n=1 Tax=Didymodactylos carnosus TaxID=1234261 RepID=A0A813P7J9_9BILA|nr:unnamed protein product [Didymodactylos carnosus]CAF0958150.1 unnamed protein product [Didymodactylos carnosus]CAF3530007.1 unnamed protein product [Didymodactylos carnosus]CAF3731130.1 unnamed protein product [Didymodactylos carnosus]
MSTSYSSTLSLREKKSNKKKIHNVLKQKSEILYRFIPLEQQKRLSSLKNRNSSNSTNSSSNNESSPKSSGSTDNNKFSELSTKTLTINDPLDKDGSRHHVVHKGSEETIRKRREKKRAKRSEAKKKKNEEKVIKANERWKKYTAIDYELALFISRYYDGLPLCIQCRTYFETKKTKFLGEQPNANDDYAAKEAIRNTTRKNMTPKQAARLIKDYDKQADILFNLCDNCLETCEEIRMDLKNINEENKIKTSTVVQNLSPQPDTVLSSLVLTPQPSVTVPLPTIYPSLLDNDSFSPTLINLQPLSNTFYTSVSVRVNDTYKTQLKSAPLNSYHTYVKNMLDYHQSNVEELYLFSQHIISLQYQSPPMSSHLQHELNICLSQMQYHCIEIFRLQYPSYTLSIPYGSTYDSEYVSYRHTNDSLPVDDNEQDQEQEPPTKTIHNKDDRWKLEIPETTDETESVNDVKYDNRSTHQFKDDQQRSLDDRLTIKSYNGVMEYRNAPLDDFIRGLEVLKCLSVFNKYPSQKK